MIEQRERRRRDGTTYTVWRVRWREGPAPSAARRSTARPTRGRSRRRSARSSARARSPTSTPARETLAEFVEEWWTVYAGPNLERATLRAYAQLLERPRAAAARPSAAARAHAADDRALPRRPRGRRRRHRGDPQDDDDAPGRAAARGRVGPRPEQRGEDHAQAAEAAPAGGPGDPADGDRGHARAAARATAGCATRRCSSVLAYAGLRPQEALALEWRHVRERTLLVERALSDGQLKALKNRRQPRTVELLAPLREDLAAWRAAQGDRRPTALRVPVAAGGVLARDGLAQLAQAHLQAGRRGGRHRRRAPVRPAPRVRVAADPRGPAVGRRDRRAARAQPDRLPRHLRARDGRARGRPRVAADEQMPPRRARRRTVDRP